MIRLLFVLVFAFVAGCEKTPPVSQQRTSETTAEAAAVICEHGVPEALCPKCNPALKAVYMARKDWCEEHQMPESFCPICHPDTTAPDVAHGEVNSAVETRIVRFRQTEMETTVGIKTVPVKHVTQPTLVECNTHLDFNKDHMADVRALVPGVIKKMHVKLGQNVAVGDPLFDLESTTLGNLQTSLTSGREQVRVAKSNLSRLKDLQKDNLVSTRQVELAEQDLAQANAQVGSAENTLRSSGAKSSGAGRFTLKSPIAGTVLARPAIQGMLATEDASLATIVDTATMWAFCDIRESDISRVAIGQKVELHLDGVTTPFEGVLNWISPAVDLQSRTVSTRVEVPNPDAKLRANQFGRASILASEDSEALAVPSESIQRVEGKDVVFVRDEPAVFSPRIVTRITEGEWVQVKGRLKAGDEVVTNGAVFLRTEAMPGSIGAGCCEATPGGK